MVKKLKTVTKPSVVPFYAVAATWLVYTVKFGMHKLSQIILCGAISLAVYFITKGMFPGKAVQVEVPEKAPDTGNAELDETIVQGRGAVKKIQKLNDLIPDKRISEQLVDIESTTAKIFARLETDKTQITQCRQFLNYYLPTTIKLLEQYVVLQNQGARAGNIAEAMEKIEGMIGKIQSAFRKQLDGLFASNTVDISAEITVMEQMMKTQGLTEEKDF